MEIKELDNLPEGFMLCFYKKESELKVIPVDNINKKISWASWKRLFEALSIMVWDDLHETPELREVKG